MSYPIDFLSIPQSLGLKKAVESFFSNLNMGPFYIQENTPKNPALEGILSKVRGKSGMLVSSLLYSIFLEALTNSVNIKKEGEGRLARSVSGACDS